MSGAAFGVGGGGLCPCGSGIAYSSCCQPLHRGVDRASSAEQLMRSRYAAFAKGEVDYLRRTWHRSTRPASLHLDGEVQWVRLEVVSAEQHGDRAVVHFRAHHRLGAGGPTGVQDEASRFVLEHGQWFYLDGARGDDA